LCGWAQGDDYFGPALHCYSFCASCEPGSLSQKAKR
jgi:hypothetical protein